MRLNAESGHLRGTPVAGMAWRPLNKSLEAGTAGSHFRIPVTHSAGGTTPGRPRELGQVALVLGKAGTGVTPGANLVAIFLECDHGCVPGRLVGEQCLLTSVAPFRES